MFGSTAAIPTNTCILFEGGRPQQSNLFGSTTNANPLLDGFFGSSTLGTSTIGSGQQPLAQQQQLNTGSLLSSRSAGGLGQQQNDPASQHANITARFGGIYNAWSPASPQSLFQVPFLLVVFFFDTEGDLTALLLRSHGSEPSQFVSPSAKCY